MGMTACYMEASSALIEELKKKTSGEIFDRIEELQDEDELRIYDMDKLWDGLHFLLTGVSAVAPAAGGPLSEAIIGTRLFITEQSADYISYINPPRAAEISAALDSFDIEKALSDFTPSTLAKNDIYPTIWRDDDKDGLSDELRGEFEGIRQFFREMRDAHQGVIVSIY